MTSFTKLVQELAALHGKRDLTLKPDQSQVQLGRGSQDFTLCELPKQQMLVLHALRMQGISLTPDLPPIRKIEAAWPRKDYEKRGWSWTQMRHPESSVSFHVVRTPMNGLTAQRLDEMIDDFIAELDPSFD